MPLTRSLAAAVLACSLLPVADAAAKTSKQPTPKKTAEHRLKSSAHTRTKSSFKLAALKGRTVSSAKLTRSGKTSTVKATKVSGAVARGVVQLDVPASLRTTKSWYKTIRLTVRSSAQTKPKPKPKPTTPDPAPQPDPGTVGPADPGPAPSTFAQPSCVEGATNVSSAAQIRSSLLASKNVCVTSATGDVDLSDVRPAQVRHVGTGPGGSIGAIRMDEARNLTFRARFRSTKITLSDNITIEQSVIGGTRQARVLDQLIFVPEDSHDLTIRDNDIGWTTADYSGNAGYGIRAYNGSARLRIERNYLHHLGGDAIQLGMDGPDTLVDRNEIAYVARPANSDEHSDDLQITGNGPNMRITNNYLHHNGVWDETGAKFGGSSGPYIHAGDTASLLVENNLVRDEGNFLQVGDLGTGGCSKSNVTFRRNTFINNGWLFESGPEMQWSLCGGSNNVFERNVINQTLWVKYPWAQSNTTERNNLVGGQYAISAAGECTLAACNPAGQEPIGFRKPSGVRW